MIKARLKPMYIFLYAYAVTILLSYTALHQPAYANTPGLPFTETFADTDLQNIPLTTADWAINTQQLTLNQPERIKNAFHPTTTQFRRFGGFSSSAPEPRHDIVSSDFNSDGRPDVAVAVGQSPDSNDTTSPSIRIFLHDGDANPYNISSSAILLAPSNSNDDTRSLASADLDLDGDIDLVAGNLGANRIYLNDDATSPLFNQVIHNLSVADTYAVALGDINQDNFPDLIIANNGQNQLIINDGNQDNDNHPFSNTPITLPGGNLDSRAIALADINADGQLDIVIANHNSVNQVLLNQGASPWFTGANNVGGTADSHGLAVGDLDGDQDLDIVVANFGSANQWYRQDNGNFTAIPLDNDNALSAATVVLDADNDGDLDIAFGHHAAINQMHINNGSNTPFADNNLLDIGSNDAYTSGMVILDSDQNGLIDIWSSNVIHPTSVSRNRGYGYVNRGSGDAGFDLTNTVIENHPINLPQIQTRALKIGDINRDGLLDAVVAIHPQGTNSTGQPSLLYLNNGTDTPYSSAPQNIISTANSNIQRSEELALADVNNDGYLDLILTLTTAPSEIYLNDKSNTPFDTIPAIQFDDSLQVYSVATGDFNRDGWIDIVTDYDFGQSPARLYLNTQAPPYFDTPQTFGNAGSDPTTEAFDAVAHDFNHDGYLDVAIMTASALRSKLYLHNQSATPFSDLPIDIESGPTKNSFIGLPLDANRDGKIDLLIGNAQGSDKTNQLFLNQDTNPPFDSGNLALPTGNFDTRHLLANDYDRDGQTEIIHLRPFEENNLITELSVDTSGNITFSSTLARRQPNSNPTGTALEMEHGDIDHDGDIDVMFVSIDSGQATFFLRNDLQPQPFLNATENAFIADSSNTTDTIITDINQDGEVDVMTTTLNGQNLIYLNNDTSDSFAGVNGLALPGSVNNAYGLTHADIDLDGDPDLVVAINGQNHLLLNNDSADPFAAVSPINFGANTESRALAAGDVDLDGDIDIVSAEFNDINSLYLNDRSGNPFVNNVSTIELAASPSTDIALADINIDGYLDVVIANDNQDDVVFFNTTTPPYFDSSNPVSLPGSSGGSSAIHIADLDNDGDDDIAMATLGGMNRVYIYDRNAQVFNGANVGTTIANSTDIQAIDIDYDGDKDLVVTNNGNVDKIFDNGGSGTLFSTATTGIDLFASSHNSQSLAIDDVDYDGLLDIVVGTNGQNHWYERGQPIANHYNLNANVAGSIEVDNGTDPITEIVLEVDETLAPNTRIDYFLSNNDGMTFFPVVPNQTFTFPTTGNQLRWKAVLYSDSPAVTPILNELKLRIPSADTPPVTSGIDDVMVNEDAANTVIDLELAFEDAETADANLIYSITSTVDTTLLTATINSDNELVLDYVANASGMDSLTIQAEDAAQQTITTTFWVEVTAVNDPPTTSGINDVTVQEDAANSSIPLPPAFDDIETSDSDLSFAVTNNTNTTLFDSISVDSNGQLILDYAADAFGQAALTVTAQDADNATISTTFTVTVTPVNDPPTTSGIANVNVNEDAPPNTVALFPAFDDLETPDTGLSFNITNNTQASLFSNLSINNSGELILSYANHASGQATLTVTTTDAGGLSIDTTFTVTVSAVNDMPISNGINPLNVLEDANDSSVSLYPVFDDVETPDTGLTFNITNNNNAALFSSASVDNNGNLIIDYAPNAFGQANLTLSATDADNATVTTVLTVNVAPVNDAPTANTIPPVTVNEDANDTNILLFPIFDDVETADVNLNLSVNNNTNTALFDNVSIDSNGQLVINYAANANGQATITLAATDQDNATALTTVDITINPVNDLPTSTGINDLVVPINSTASILDLFTVFDDIETADNHLDLNIENNTNSALFNAVSISNNGQLTLDYATGATGQAIVSLSATDSNNAKITITFKVTINAAGDFESRGGGGSTNLFILIILGILALIMQRRLRKPHHLNLVYFVTLALGLTTPLAATHATDEPGCNQPEQRFTTRCQSGWSLSAGFGISRSLASPSDYIRALNQRGHNVSLVEAERTEPSGQISLGYYWGSLGLELGYAHLGNFRTRFSGSAANLNQLADDVAELQPIGGSVAHILGSIHWPLDTAFSWRSQLGASYFAGSDIELDLNGQRISTSTTAEWAATVGLGLHYQIDNHHSFGLETRYHFIDRGDVALYTAGYHYRF